MRRSIDDDVPDGWMPKGPEARVCRRVKTQPFRWFSWGLVVLAIPSFFFMLPVGVLLIIAAVLLDRSVWICEGCGNKVEKTSMLCPSCGARLVSKMPKSPKAMKQPKINRRRPQG